MTQLIASNQLTLTNVNDGQTAVIHWAYADNADGTGLTLTDNGQRYIGQYSDYTQADSTDKTKYRWADRWAKIDVGGVNLIKNGGYPTNTQYWSGHMIVSQHSFYYNGQKKLFLLQTTRTAEITASTNRFDVKRNTNYTLSFYAFAGSNVKSSDVFFLGRKSNETVGFSSAKAIISARRFSESGAEYVTVTFNSGDNDSGYIRFDNNGSLDGVNAVLFFGEVMLAEGNAPQKWSASYDEIAANIDTKADQALTQEQLVELTNQTNRIQANMEALAAAKALTDLEKAYKEYVRANDAAKKVSEGELATLKERTAEHVTKLAKFAEDWEFMTTKLRIAEEGIYFGKLDGSSEIKITDDRISFWSSDKEVMWITAGVLNIDNGIFTVSVQIGRFREEQYTTNPDINVIRYVC